MSPHRMSFRLPCRWTAPGTYLLAAGVSTSLTAQAIGIYQINSTTGLLTALTGSPLALYTGKASTPTVLTQPRC